MRKRKGTSSLNYFKSQAEENSSCKFIKNPKPCAKEDKNINFLEKNKNKSKPRTEEDGGTDLQEQIRTLSERRIKPFPNLM